MRLFILVFALYIPAHTWYCIASDAVEARLQKQLDIYNNSNGYELDMSEYCEIFKDDDCWLVRL